MKEKAIQTFSPDPSSTFPFALELKGGTAVSGVASLPTYSDRATLLRYVHEKKVQQDGNVRALFHKIK